MTLLEKVNNEPDNIIKIQAILKIFTDISCDFNLENWFTASICKKQQEKAEKAKKKAEKSKRKEEEAKKKAQKKISLETYMQKVARNRGLEANKFVKARAEGEWADVLKEVVGGPQPLGKDEL